jgi:protein transport protein DSL1/ZW10
LTLELFADLAENLNELGPGATKIVRQCLRQLEVLKNVWQIILPTQLYNKSMGTLLNEFCGDIIKRICSLEDISSDVANGLVDLIGTIVEKAPSIFEVSYLRGLRSVFLTDKFMQDPLQVSIHVKLWTKLSQLRMILGASLIQITEQWSEGKGPLTLNYKAEDVKNLIRALFQNTDRRANALASII